MDPFKILAAENLPRLDSGHSRGYLSFVSKKNKQRFCPSLNQHISSRQCGEERQSRIRCHADCQFNPFNPALYDEIIEMEMRFEEQCIARLESEWPSNKQRLNEVFKGVSDEDGPVAVEYFIESCKTLFAFFFLQDQSGKTPCDRWVETGWAGLTNDERILAEAHRSIRFTMLEVQRATSSETVECIDLLRPEAGSITLCHRPLTTQALPYQLCLSWIYRLPHYWRIAGTAVPVPARAGFAGRDLLAKLVEGGPPIGDNGLAPRCVEVLRETRGLFEQQRDERMDTLEQILDRLRDSRHECLDVLIHEPVSALEGLSPSQAAAHPVHLEKLVRWAKVLINLNEVSAVQRASRVDLEPLLKPLNLSELIVPPGPAVAAAWEEFIDERNIPLTVPAADEIFGRPGESLSDYLLRYTETPGMLEHVSKIHLNEQPGLTEFFQSIPEGVLHPAEAELLKSVWIAVYGWFRGAVCPPVISAQEVFTRFITRVHTLNSDDELIARLADPSTMFDVIAPDPAHRPIIEVGLGVLGTFVYDKQFKGKTRVSQSAVPTMLLMLATILESCDAALAP